MDSYLTNCILGANDYIQEEKEINNNENKLYLINSIDFECSYINELKFKIIDMEQFPKEIILVITCANIQIIDKNFKLLQKLPLEARNAFI